MFQVFEVIVENRNISISKLSKITGYSKSTIQRIVNSLKFLRYIDQNEHTYDYFPTLKIFELGSNVANDLTIKSIAKPFLLKLYNEVDETVNLGILDNLDVVYLDKIVSKSPLRVELELGIRIPLYCSSLGKSIAAFNKGDVTFGDNYIKYTKKTITSDDALRNELSSIKKQGFAIDNEEYINGLICIGVPVLNSSGYAIASISISIPAIRYNADDLFYYVSLLNKHATLIQNNI